VGEVATKNLIYGEYLQRPRQFQVTVKVETGAMSNVIRLRGQDGLATASGSPAIPSGHETMRILPTWIRRKQNA